MEKFICSIATAATAVSAAVIVMLSSCAGFTHKSRQEHRDELAMLKGTKPVEATHKKQKPVKDDELVRMLEGAQ